MPDGLDDGLRDWIQNELDCGLDRICNGVALAQFFFFFEFGFPHGLFVSHTVC